MAAKKKNASKTKKNTKKTKTSKPTASSVSTVRSDVLGIVSITIALMLSAAVISFHPDDPPNGSSTKIHNLLGPLGAHLANIVVHYSFGRWVSLCVPLVFLIIGIDLFRRKERMELLRRTFFPILVGAVIATSGIGFVRHLESMPQLLEVNGFAGWALTTVLLRYTGILGMGLLLVAALLIYTTLLLRIRWIDFFSWIWTFIVASLGGLITTLSAKRKARPKPAKKAPAPKQQQQTEDLPKPDAHSYLEQIEQWDDEEEATGFTLVSKGEHSKPEIVVPHQLSPLPTVKNDQEAPSKNELEEDPSIYKLPPIELLDEPEEGENPDIDEEILRETAQGLEERLGEFGVSAQVVAIHPGPVITRYDLKPAPGVKVSKITALGDDLALALSANALRIIAPIPGAGAVGVEVPNPKSQMVHMHGIVASEAFQNADSPLAIALGKTAQGDDFVVDLAKMPHLLIAGTTGSGKSVCINTIIASLLMRNKPQEVMIAMVDPKKIELSAYAELRRHHLLFIEDSEEVIATEPKNAVMLLQSIVREMEKRYDRLAETGARNIVEFNRLIEKGMVSPDDEDNAPKPLPYLVMIVDELADLMLTAAREVEEPIARLAQMARAVGIHLVVATQRPSVDVLTGVIKANFPARIAFMVATKIDSRTILDRSGAEALLGKGDGLFLAGTSPQPVRFHGAFISTEEVHKLIAYVHNQPKYIKSITLDLPAESGRGGGPSDSLDERDVLFEEAVRIVARHQQGSVSLLQRRLKVGYSRAGRLLDQLEQAGIVGPFEGSKAREVTLDPNDVDSFLSGTLHQEES